MSLYPSIIPRMTTEWMKNLKKVGITVYKTVLSYSYNSAWFGNTITWSFLSMSHLLMGPPSIRIDLNYRAMAALVVIQQGSHILTQNSMSLCAMRPVRAVNTVLVCYLFHTKKPKDWIWLSRHNSSKRENQNHKHKKIIWLLFMIKSFVIVDRILWIKT